MDKKADTIKNVSSKGTRFIEQIARTDKTAPSMLLRVLLWLRSCLRLEKK